MASPGGMPSLPPEYLQEDIGYKLLDTAIAFMVLTTIIYALFVTSRLFCAERNGWEFWILYPVSYLTCMTLCVTCILSVRHAGAGRHVAYLLMTDPNEIVLFLKLQTANEFIYVLSVSTPKIALLLLYLRIFANRTVRILTWIVVALIVTNFFASGVITGFIICQPFAFKWDKTIPGGHCADLMAAYKYVSIPNILFDVAIAILPLSTLYHLQVSKLRKFGLIITFLAGSLGLITAIIRLVGFFTVDLASDLTYFGVDTYIYTIVEPCAYFICSCLPGIRPLLRVGYNSTGLRALVSRRQANSRSGNAYSHELSLGNVKGSHRALVYKGSAHDSEVNDNMGGFICLNEEVIISHSPNPHFTAV